MKKNEVEFISAEMSIQLLSPASGSISDSVRWCPSLVLCILFEATSDPQSGAVFFRLGWSLLFCPAGCLSAQGPGVFHLMSGRTTHATSTCLQRGLLLRSGGCDPQVSLGSLYSVFREHVGCGPCPCTTHVILSQIISSNVQFVTKSLFHVRGQSV